MTITILYGSETGIAQDFAEQIWKLAQRYKYSCKIDALDNYNVQLLPTEDMVIFVVSTTGQGAMPSNMRKFWKFLLNKKLSRSSLSEVEFCILGLGDSSYQRFNYAARKLQSRLLQLGAKPFLSIALANDQDELGIDSVAGPFIKLFFEKWNKANGLSETKIDNETLITKFDIDVIEDDFETSNDDIYVNLKENKSTGRIISNERTTSKDHFQDVRLIKIFAKNLNYEPGDVLCVRPKNSPDKVNTFFNLLKENHVKIKENNKVQISKIDIAVPKVLQQNVTIRQLVEYYWDLNAIPTRSVIENLAIISQDELEKSRLFEFCQPGDLEDLYNYINRPRRTILEVLHDFPKTTANLNESNIFEVLTPIRPRSFSIASSLNFSENEIHILMAIVRYKTKLFEPRIGLCSNWLAQLKPGSEVNFWIQSGTFVFDHKSPMILIGPGTGVAPFRSLLLEKASRNEDLRECVLFFGCRYKEKDYHCKEDFEMLAKKHNLKLFCAFSRDQEDKIYVQHLIKQEAKLLWNLLEKNASIYLAGNAKNMPKAVREEFVNIVITQGRLNTNEAEAYIEKMETRNRYQSEIWA